MKGVVVCPSVEAVEVGRRILEDGGNAVDAAVATAFAQGIAEPQVTSIGGNGTLQVFHAESGQHLVIDFYGRAPLKATTAMWADKVIERLPADMWALEGQVNQKGYLSVTVPGTLMALHEVASRFATMPWKELLAPAIELAETGFTVQDELATSWVREGMLGYANTEDILMAGVAAGGHQQIAQLSKVGPPQVVQLAAV
ncbi:MAG: gamma-glutamyltransferase [Chloroflexi bacterium]|nr:gamma-glutamyltransferase [Chloroflexota bacterium]